jgi:hypothetical protein
VSHILYYSLIFLILKARSLRRVRLV